MSFKGSADIWILLKRNVLLLLPAALGVFGFVGHDSVQNDNRVKDTAVCTEFAQRV